MLVHIPVTWILWEKKTFVTIAIHPPCRHGRRCFKAEQQRLASEAEREKQRVTKLSS